MPIGTSSSPARSVYSLGCWCPMRFYPKWRLLSHLQSRRIAAVTVSSSYGQRCRPHRRGSGRSRQQLTPSFPPAWCTRNVRGSQSAERRAWPSARPEPRRLLELGRPRYQRPPIQASEGEAPFLTQGLRVPEVGRFQRDRTFSGSGVNGRVCEGFRALAYESLQCFRRDPSLLIPATKME